MASISTSHVIVNLNMKENSLVKVIIKKSLSCSERL